MVSEVNKWLNLYNPSGGCLVLAPGWLESSSLNPTLSLSSENLSEGSSRRYSKVERVKSTAKLLGQPSSTAWEVGRVGLASTNTGCFQVGSSHCWLSRAATGSLEENMLPLLWYWLIQESKRFWFFVTFGCKEHFFFFHVSCSMRIEPKLCEVKIFQLQSMSNAVRCIDQRFAFKNSGISCRALIFNLKNPRTTMLYAKKMVAGCEIQRVIYHFYQSTNMNQLLSG